MPPCRLPPGTVPGLGVASEAAPGTERNGGEKNGKTGEKEGREKHRNLSNHPNAPLAQSEPPESRERGGKMG